MDENLAEDLKINQQLKTHGDSISKTFCVLPWIHLNTWPNGNVYPCCLTDWREDVGNLKDNTLEEIWNNDKMKEIRQHMLQGKKHNSCRKCFQQEDYNLDSTRTSSNRLFSHHIPTITENTNEDGHNDDFKLLYWDFRFSNLCNFKCRMCGSALSSKWYEDEVKIFGHSDLPQAIINVNDYSKKNINEYLDEFIHDVEEIYFAGGEPLLMDEHYYILEKLLEIGKTDVRIRYNTNLGFIKFKKWDNLELWKPFRDREYTNVSIFASIDGIGKNAEYSRKGTKWDVVEGNIKRLIDADFNIHISATTSIFTVWEVPELVDRMLEIGMPDYAIQLNNVLTSPLYYHVNILPDEFKDKIKQKYTNHLNSMSTERQEIFKPKYDSIFRFLDEPVTEDVNALRKGFKHITDILDKGREESFVDVYPYHKEWYESIDESESINLKNII